MLQLWVLLLWKHLFSYLLLLVLLFTLCNFYCFFIVINNLWLPYLILLMKVLFMCVFAILTRGTVPRYRIDQFTQLNWKHFIFIWLMFLTFSFVYFVMFI